jgi:hypothetical protein
VQFYFDFYLRYLRLNFLDWSWMADMGWREGDMERFQGNVVAIRDD